jgi:hypothetical protein
MQEPSEEESQPSRSKILFEVLNKEPKQIMAAVGYILLGVSAFIGAVLTNTQQAPITPIKPDESQFVWFTTNFAYPIRSLLILVFLAFFGFTLLGAAGKITPRVIPDEDRDLLTPLVKDANKEAIAQYVILSSLTGFTGNFQKIGFSGLPLATATLTLIFSFLSFWKLEFIEFAKLTLGAFIGSFVQRNVETERLRLADIESSVQRNVEMESLRQNKKNAERSEEQSQTNSDS